MSYSHETNPDNIYLEIVKKILNSGNKEKTRNGETISKFGVQMNFDLSNGKIPFLHTKKLAWKTCFRELFWFLSGSTDNRILQNQNIHIWNGNASKDFLNSRNINYEIEGDLGPVYGFQWRHFGANYKTCETNYENEGIDQISELINNLSDSEKRQSRRLILTAWNPTDLNKMALPPCHLLAQFHVSNNNELSCLLFQRSGDIGLGVPFNILSYSLLTHIIAKHCGLVAKEFIHVIGNAHIYTQHVEQLNLQIERGKNIEQTNKEVIIDINKREKIEDYCLDDIIFIKPYETIYDKLPMQLIV